MALALNNLKPAKGSTHKKKRVGRGPGSGLGKTSGRGHKGQKSRLGYSSRPGFEGGQMPLQRRLPKRGFISLTRNDTAEVRLSEIAKMPGDTIDLMMLKQAGIVSIKAIAAKVVLSGTIEKKVKLSGIATTKGAKAAIEAAGGSVEEIVKVVRPRKLPKK